MSRAALAPAACAAAAAGLAACQSTQDTSTMKAGQAKGLAQQRGLVVRRVNPDVRVTRTAVLQDRNGVAAVLGLRNTGRAQTGVPIAIAVTDRAGRALYRNDAPGLEASLVGVPLLERGERTFWVNNQVAATGRPARVRARVGVAGGRVPARIPRIVVSRVRLGRDSDGVFARGVVTNRSAVTQRRLVVSCVARRGDRVVAAGRAIVDRLPPGAGRKPTPFTVFFIGDPRGARLAFSAPPTTLTQRP